LINCIKQCKNLQTLNISDLNIKRKYISEVSAAIIESLSQGLKLETLIWNYDLAKSNTKAKEFLNEIENVFKQGKSSLKKISMTGVFQL